MDPVKTGRLIAQIRKEKNLTQKELSQRLHVSIQAVSKWERGLNFPDISLLEPLSDALGLTVSELLTGERGEPSQALAVHTALQAGMAQLKRQGRRWRTALLLLGIFAFIFALLGGFLWLRDNTELFPQPETSVTPRPLSEREDMLIWANAEWDRSAYLYDIALADDNNGFCLQLELWSGAGLERTWGLLEGAGSPVQRHGQLSLYVSAGGLPPTFSDPQLTLHVQYMGLSAKPLTLSLSELETEGIMAYPLKGRAVESHDEGTALITFSLQGADGAYYYPQIYGGRLEKPSAAGKDASFLVLKFYTR